MSQIADRLDTLLGSFRSKGIDPGQNLKPGLSEAELDGHAARLKLVLPPAVRDLYAWRNGLADPYAENDRQFVFRDQSFLSLDDAEEAIAHIRGFLSAYASAGLDLPVDPDALLPIAALEGQFYAVPTGEGLAGLPGPHPVILLGEEMAVHFFSIESMIETCIDWVNDPSFDAEDFEVEDDETAWERHNPGALDIELE